MATSSALFGLWHVLPTLEALGANDLAGSPAARTAAVVGAVALTGAVGVQRDGLASATIEAMRRDARELVDAAVEAAERAPLPSADTLEDGVFAEQAYAR